jgi:hypothetical protein
MSRGRVSYSVKRSISILLVGCAFAAQSSVAQHSAKIEFKASVVSSNEIKLVLALRNRGEKPVWLNGRLTTEETPCHREQKAQVVYRLVDSRGRVLSSGCNKNGPRARAEHGPQRSNKGPGDAKHPAMLPGLAVPATAPGLGCH